MWEKVKRVQFPKLNCMFGLHIYTELPDGKIKCMRCGKEIRDRRKKRLPPNHTQ